MTLREDVIERSDSSEGIYGLVEKADFCLVIPVDERGFHLVEQFRYPVGGRFLEFPQGSWEEQPGADPQLVAAGELAEETGLRAGSLQHLGHLFQAYGYSTQGFHVFLATDLASAPTSRPQEEQDLVTRHIDFDEFEDMVMRSQIKDASSLAAYALYRLNVGR